MMTVSGCSSEASCGCPATGGGKVGRDGDGRVLPAFDPALPEVGVEPSALLVPKSEEKKRPKAANNFPSMIGLISYRPKIIKLA